MAAVPPPPPQPPFDPRMQARLYREQQRAALRAQRDALRAQRMYWRARRRPSITGPILTIAVGVVALLIFAGKINGAVFWEWFSRWWPVLLIATGLLSLLEWFLDRENPYGARRSGIGFIVFILLLAGFAHSRNYWGPMRDEFNDENNGFFSFLGDEHEHDTDADLAVPANAAVQVQNPRGDVTVTASPDEKAHIHSHLTVRTSSDDKADELFRRLEPQLTVSGGSALIRVDAQQGGSVALTIELPATASLDIKADRGDISVDGMKNGANATANHGEVKFDTVTGSVHAHMNDSDSTFTAHSVIGDLSVDGRVGDASISDVKGNVLLEGDFFGDTHLEQVTGNVRFHSSRTELQVARLDGDMTIDKDNIHIGQAAGPVRVVGRSRDIECTQISGDIHIENANGEVNVSTVVPLGTISITNENKTVTLTLPKNANANVSAVASEGDIENDFGLSVSGSSWRRTASGKVGRGGPQVQIVSTHADIQLRSDDSTSVEAAPVPPAAPAPPAAPESAAKHLKAPRGQVPAPTEE